MKTINCYCGRNKAFENCCQPYIKGIQKAPTALALMRSRYSAYAVQAVDYLVFSTHSSKRDFHSRTDILDWAKSNRWTKLDIISASENVVEFKAHHYEIQNDQNSMSEIQIHHERSTFVFENGSWFYVDGIFIDDF
jgi:SEC-C motif-containing protein